MQAQVEAAEAELARVQAVAEAANARAELERLRADAALGEVDSDGSSSQGSDVEVAGANAGADRRQQIERSLIDLEEELAAAEIQDSENRRYNERLLSEAMEKIDGAKRQQKQLQEEGKTGQALALALATSYAESEFKSGSLAGKKPINSSESIRSRISALRKELLDMNK